MPARALLCHAGIPVPNHTLHQRENGRHQNLEGMIQGDDEDGWSPLPTRTPITDPLLGIMS